MWIAEIYLYQKSSLVTRNLPEGGGREYEGTNITLCNEHVKLEVGSQVCITQ